MAMVVQHNLTAMNANRQLGITTGAQAKSSEKLSSGYRINRAGDDAAGLKISEKMRSQVRGLNKASSNAQDGISLIQTAEGALNEAHSILQRMNELSVQGANDTNQNIDRDAINQELTALTEELDRISTTTQFNKQNLLDGSFSDKKLQVGANAGQSINITIGKMDAKSLGLTDIKYFEGQKSVSYAGISYMGTDYTYDVNKTAEQNKAAFKAAATETGKAAFTKDMIAKVIGTVQMDAGLSGLDPSVKPKAPGMKYRHYAPKASMTVIQGEKEAVIRRIEELAAEYPKEKVGILAADETLSCYTHGQVVSAGSRNEHTIEQGLYRALREFDHMGVSVIFSESFADDDRSEAIMNRLLKAAGQKIEYLSDK